MAEVPSFSLQQRVSQNQKQIQTQKLSMQQLQSIKLLALSTQDLRSEIYNAVSKNPALEITKDFAFDGVEGASEKELNFPSSDYDYSSNKKGDEASDIFQKALESSPDTRESLYEHLTHQFLSTNHSPSEESLGLKLINNLDSSGFHILSPYSLVDSKDLIQTPQFVDKTLSLIQQLDPVGTATKDFKESLFVQAKAAENAPELALFILNGNFDVLLPPKVQNIQKKLKEILAKNEEISPKPDISPQKIEETLEFIKTLDPFPARNFFSSQTRYVFPEVYVQKNPETGEYSVSSNDEILPVLKVSKDFEELSLKRTRITKSTEQSEKLRSEHRFIVDSVKNAKDFIESLQFRKKIVLLSCQEIVSFQIDFFEKGPSFLKPLRQKDIAEKVGVSEATISRMAKEKYLSCSRGVFQIGYFFSNEVAVPKSLESQNKKSIQQKNKSETTKENEKSSENKIFAKSAILFEIEKLLEEHKNDKKSLSDQKIAVLLEQKGIKIARRTVAKYRSELDIDSSYLR